MLHGVWGGLPREQLQTRGLGELRRRSNCTVRCGGLPTGATSSPERASVDLEDLAVARDAQRHGDPLQAVPHIERSPEGVHPCERRKLIDAEGSADHFLSIRCQCQECFGVLA